MAINVVERYGGGSDRAFAAAGTRRCAPTPFAKVIYVSRLGRCSSWLAALRLAGVSIGSDGLPDAARRVWGCAANSTLAHEAAARRFQTLSPGSGFTFLAEFSPGEFRAKGSKLLPLRVAEVADDRCTREGRCLAEVGLRTCAPASAGLANSAGVLQVEGGGFLAG